MPWHLDKVVISLIGMEMKGLLGRSNNRAESEIMCSGASQEKSRNNTMKGNSRAATQLKKNARHVKD